MTKKIYRRNFLKKGSAIVVGFAFGMLGGLKFNSKEGIRIGRERMKFGMAEANAACGTAYNCSGGGGRCGTAYNCSGGGGRCGTAYNCSGGQGGSYGGSARCGTAYNCAGGGGRCGTAYNCAGGGGRCGTAYNCAGN